MTARGSGIESRPLLAAPAAALILLRRRIAAEFRATALYRWRLGGPEPTGAAVAPRDYRPPDLDGARQILLGRLALAGETMEIGQGGDPWDTASPSRRFAVELHRFTWLPGLMALNHDQYPEAEAEALRLSLDWLSLFFDPSGFSWSTEVVERRVFNLACALPRLLPMASDLEQRRLLASLAAQATHLLRLEAGKLRRAERFAAVALTGALLSGKAGRALLAAASPQLAEALNEAVLPDGGHRSRSPEHAMELLFDLLTLDDALHQHGLPANVAVSRAIDRLTGAVRFFTLGDGRLGAFQGGESSTPARVKAATAHESEAVRPFEYAPHAGYHRLVSRDIAVLVDAAPAADGAWSLAACAHPLAMEVTCGQDRLIVNTAWRADSDAPPALRLGPGGSTATVGETSPGEPLRGFPGRAFGSRLVGGPAKLEARRNENDDGVWLELCHDGWAERFGVTHERRIFLDRRSDELRGEDAFSPVREGIERKALTPFAARFHLAPEVKVSLARDKRSVLLRGPSDRGWWFRNDAEDVALEPSLHYEDGLGRRTLQIVLKGRIGRDGYARVRWKLTPVDAAEHVHSR